MDTTKTKFSIPLTRKLSSKIISLISGTILLGTSIYLYQNGYQNNLIIAMGVLGVLKLF
jgi:hypothetical protein